MRAMEFLRLRVRNTCAKIPLSCYFPHRSTAFNFTSALQHHNLDGLNEPERPFSLNAKVLILNQSYEPISIITTKKALVLLVLMKAEVVEVRSNAFIRSVRGRYPFPSVIRLSAYLRVPFKKIELSRKNILRRDGMRCNYCGTAQPPLTVDHIIPRSRGGGESWENLTSACVKCNNKKGNRTPEEAVMRLLTQPKKPHHVLFLKHYLGKVDETWRPYLFMD